MKTFTFVIQIWLEKAPHLPAPVVRGSIQQAGSEQKRYFNSLEEGIALLKEMAGVIFHVPSETEIP